MELRGIVADITFQNETTGFTVLRLDEEDSGKIHSCVGILPTAQKGETVLLKGDWTDSPRFGRQFNVSSYEFLRPVTEKGIELLLGSGLFDNIGPSRAKKIIDVFGQDTLDILDTRPDRLLEVSGIGKKMLCGIKAAWDRQRHIRGLLLYLQQFGVSVNMVNKIYKVWGEKAREKLSSNPYALIDEIRGVGFIKADAIARHLGFPADSFRRIKAGILFLLQSASEDGHVYLPRNELIDKSTELLGVPREQVEYSADHLKEESAVIDEDGRIYMPLLHRVESSVGRMLNIRALDGRSKSGYSDDFLTAWFERYRAKTGREADDLQMEALKAAVSCRVLIITGGPGTGKTTTLQAIVSFFRERSVTVALAAPTGRAAQRMGTIAGIPASTIHRLLEYRPDKEGFFFARNERNPIAAGVVIIDETSMLDIHLTNHLLRATNPDSTIIFVGDSNQLPSVGAGNVLADMIAAGNIRHVRLTRIFRQAAMSCIVTTAHDIINGRMPSFSNSPDSDCFFVSRTVPSECLDTVVDLVTVRLPNRYGLDPLRDIQVLSPIHRGELGTQAFNRALQARLNPTGPRITRGETVFAAGDKVMQLKNNYDKSVFNGDIGFITAIREESVLIVDFGEQRVEYGPHDTDELTHAYCISVHKSQGSEFQAVVLPLMTQHYIMLQRNLIYTAITRARKLCVIAGMQKALFQAVSNNSAQMRYSRLSARIAEHVKT
jgi:exodeoxyribonuclease V alpha subunit